MLIKYFHHWVMWNSRKHRHIQSGFYWCSTASNAPFFSHLTAISIKWSKAKNKLIKAYQNRVVNPSNKKLKQAKLKPLNGSCHAPLSKGLPYTQQDYFDLVYWTGPEGR